MKRCRWLLAGLLMVIVSGVCLEVTAQPPGLAEPGVEMDFVLAPGVPYPPPGLAPGGVVGMELEPGLVERAPELARLVRDIVALRLINRADLSAEQIEKVLPVLRRLAKEQDALVKEVREALLAERARLLKEKGPPAPRAGRLPAMRERAFAYRAEVERAKVELGKIISAPQAEILGRLITPPSPVDAFGRRGFGPGWPGQGGPGPAPGMVPHGLPPGPSPGMGPGAGIGAGPRAGQRMRARDGMGGRLFIDLDRLVELLEEKLAAMRGTK